MKKADERLSISQNFSGFCEITVCGILNRKSASISVTKCWDVTSLLHKPQMSQMSHKKKEGEIFRIFDWKIFFKYP